MSRRFAVSLRHDETLGSVGGGLGVQADGLIETRGADLSIEAAFPDEHASAVVSRQPDATQSRRLEAGKTPGDARKSPGPALNARGSFFPAKRL